MLVGEAGLTKQDVWAATWLQARSVRPGLEQQHRSEHLQGLHSETLPPVCLGLSLDTQLLPVNRVP